MKSKPYFIVLNVAMGWSDIELEVILKDVDELIEKGEDINNKFPDAIKTQKYWFSKKIHKVRWLPEMEF